VRDDEPANILRDALDAGLRYYGRLGRLALEGGALLVPVLRQLRPQPVAAPAAPPAGPAADAPAGRRAERTVLLEPTAGTPGLGVFLVENLTADPVSAEIAVSPLSGPTGEQVPPALRFSPEKIALEPGDQVLVQVAAAADEALEPGVRYRAEISIPGLSGVRVPIVVRRRLDGEEG
jgi:hypothetical protein